MPSFSSTSGCCWKVLLALPLSLVVLVILPHFRVVVVFIHLSLGRWCCVPSPSIGRWCSKFTPNAVSVVFVLVVQKTNEQTKDQKRTHYNQKITILTGNVPCFPRVSFCWEEKGRGEKLKQPKTQSYRVNTSSSFFFGFEQERHEQRKERGSEEGQGEATNGANNSV